MNGLENWPGRVGNLVLCNCEKQGSIWLLDFEKYLVLMAGFAAVLLHILRTIRLEKICIPSTMCCERGSLLLRGAKLSSLVKPAIDLGCIA